MPDFGSATFSQTDASNATGTMPSWSGAAAPSTLDDAGRALQGAVTREWNWRNFTVTSAGTGTALTLTYSVAPAAYYNGQRFAFITNTAVTGSCTLNVNSLGATTIKKVLGGTLTNLASGDIPAGRFVEVAYNTANTCFVLVDSILPLVSDSSGNVGIGVTPSYKLDVISSNGMIARFGNTAGSTTGGATIVSTSADQGIFGGGYDYNGTNFIARSTTASYVICGSGLVQLANASGLTVGSSATITARMQLDSSGSFLQISSGGIGYGTGSGGTVTQLTSRTTSVTLNKTNGAVTLFTAAGVTGSWTTFQVFNSTVAATDTVVVSVKTGATNTYIAAVPSVGAGNFSITFISLAGTASDAPVINFAVIKAVTS